MNSCPNCNPPKLPTDAQKSATREHLLNILTPENLANAKFTLEHHPIAQYWYARLELPEAVGVGKCFFSLLPGEVPETAPAQEES
jgi:hypothetical protein